ncbi:5-hydroxyisourate hydrolase [Hyphomicrobiales bacterium]|nr:5-hydroxyisourate hydrolase [Hyphomicrobiales bacterium]CAH1700468.1 5-hydroxyisourate hydrolase [Hyphomicrobiales bacterium]CAI0343651.1 5-hydroxyisourate hydrolase [Hyphomicrobiales bacterium]
MAGITTHVLDSNRGRPVAGCRIDLSMKQGDGWTLIKSATTNQDGRTDTPMLAPADAKVGEFELVFHVDAHFRSQAGAGDPAPFVDRPVVRFSVFDVKQHYHVPLLCTPGSCSTYRGS